MNKLYKSFFWAVIATTLFIALVLGVALIIHGNLWGIAVVAVGGITGTTVFLCIEE
jgi:uncharacterized membrane protein